MGGISILIFDFLLCITNYFKLHILKIYEGVCVYQSKIHSTLNNFDF